MKYLIGLLILLVGITAGIWAAKKQPIVVNFHNARPLPVGEEMGMVEIVNFNVAINLIEGRHRGWWVIDIVGKDEKGEFVGVILAFKTEAQARNAAQKLGRLTKSFGEGWWFGPGEWSFKCSMKDLREE